MNTTRREHHQLLFFSMVLFASSVAPIASAQDYNRAQTSPDGPFLFWRDRIITYSLDADGSPDVDLGQTRSAVVRSFNTWESQPCTDVFFSYEGIVRDAETNHFTGEADGINLIQWLMDWPDDWGADQLAQTGIVWNARTGEILDVDIALNGESFYWTTSNITVTDIENVLTHEIGHLLGFAHTTDPDATMYDGYNEGETVKRDLAATDIRGLCEVYPSGRSTPDVPDLGRNDQELSNMGCECSTSGRSSDDLSLLALIAFVSVIFLRRRG
jgi:hypothetical protein